MKFFFYEVYNKSSVPAKGWNDFLYETNMALKIGLCLCYINNTIIDKPHKCSFMDPIFALYQSSSRDQNWLFIGFGFV